MTPDQIFLFVLFPTIFALFLWGRIRYDIVAFGALLCGVLWGVVPADRAFSGFGHPATIIVALVLIVSAGLMRSGAIAALTRFLVDTDRPAGGHIAVMGAIGAVMSGFMNNIAALALLMPVDLQTARRAKRAVGCTLMPLSFATILGGMITQIGTPPNIIIATFRAEELGTPFTMFDFAPVGGAVALAGLAFVALVGWRLLPRRGEAAERGREAVSDFIAELVVGKKSRLSGKRVGDFEDEAEAADLAILSVMREGRRRYGAARNLRLRPGDVLLVEAAPEGLEEFRSEMKLEFPAGQATHLSTAETHTKSEKDKDRDEADEAQSAEEKAKTRRRAEMASGAGMVLLEAVVQAEGRIVGKTAQSVGLSWRHQTVLMGISRQGRTIRDRVRRTRIEPGDILLLLVPEETQDDVAEWLGCLPLHGGGHEIVQGRQMGLALGQFALAIIAASGGLITMPVALGLVLIGYIVTGVLSVREIYSQVDWPVIVLLGSMIPLGLALDSTGGSGLIAGWLMTATAGLPAWVALALLMVITMTLSDILNNNATTILAAPVALNLSQQLGVSADPFLMAVAVAASCAFLTPIGHQNNTVVMGPGGYRFGDYWRMGLPLEIIVVAVAVPMILLVWPLQG
ncbi:SLC13 family permease [Rhodobacteraceae bacterium WD3A24]|nr:SLC13 family permease [Rhodobacteraceae bacterium WD3A24]